LAELAGQSLPDTQEMLVTLVQLGYVLRYSKNNETYYKPLIMWSRV